MRIAERNSNIRRSPELFAAPDGSQLRTQYVAASIAVACLVWGLGHTDDAFFFFHKSSSRLRPCLRPLYTADGAHVRLAVQCFPPFPVPAAVTFRRIRPGFLSLTSVDTSGPQGWYPGGAAVWRRGAGRVRPNDRGRVMMRSGFSGEAAGSTAKL